MIYTVGYQKVKPRWMDELVEVLEIKYLVDVRARPFSHIPGYSSTALHERYGDKYILKGTVLGGGGKVTQEGLEWLRQFDGGERPNVLLMCMEDDPSECHRHNAICGEHFPDAIHYHEGALFTARNLTALINGDKEECDTVAEVEFESP